MRAVEPQKRVRADASDAALRSTPASVVHHLLHRAADDVREQSVVRRQRQRVARLEVIDLERSTIRRANTRPSSSELEASRLAPCTPVHATRRTAYSPRIVARPHRSVRTPPET